MRALEIGGRLCYNQGMAKDSENFEHLPLSVTRRIKSRLAAEAGRKQHSLSAEAREIFNLYFDILDGRVVLLAGRLVPCPTDPEAPPTEPGA